MQAQASASVQAQASASVQAQASASVQAQASASVQAQAFTSTGVKTTTRRKNHTAKPLFFKKTSNQTECQGNHTPIPQPQTPVSPHFRVGTSSAKHRSVGAQPLPPIRASTLPPGANLPPAAPGVFFCLHAKKSAP